MLLFPFGMPKPLNILLFDPAGVHRAWLEEVFASRGHRCEHHAKAGTAWNAWRSGALRLLVVTGTSGLELCRLVAAERLPGATEILALIDQSDEAGVNELLAAGIDDLLLLPGEQRLLEARLSLVERRLSPPAVEVVSEAASKEGDERFRELWDGVPVGAYRLGVRGVFTAANMTLVQLLGYEHRADVIGMDSGSLYVDAVDREAWSTLMKKDGQVMDFETEIRHRDGSTMWVRSHTRALRDADCGLVGYHGTVEDITGRRHAEEALKASEERFRSLVQHTTDLISIVDGDGRMLYMSPAIWTVAGYPAHQRIGEDAFELIHPDDRSHVVSRFQEILEKPGTQIQLEYRLAHRDGSWRVVETVMTNQLDNPAVGGVVANTRDITDRKAAEDQLRHDTLHDSLTGLPNRVLFMDRLGHALDRNRRTRTIASAVLFLDLDRFKMVNDSLGHAVGDLLLIEAGRRLHTCLRPNDTLARLGGDEFAILLEDVKEPSDPVRVARRIQSVLELPFELDGREVYTTSSIGIAFSQETTDSPEELLRDADTAMYRAKSRGRSGHAIFDAEMHAQVLAQLKLETALRRAIDQWQFEVLYQPIVDLETGQIAGFEALVRWRHPERGLVLPAEFINLAEETGLINMLGSRVLAEACLQMKEWQDLIGNPNAWISVNLSNRQLAQRDMVDQVERVLRESGLPGSNLILELTEGVVTEQSDTILPTLERLKSLGIRLSLDDFGTGHSSLSVLHRFPFDMVKIDRWFVRNVGIDRGSDELVEGVMALCHWRRLATVAEGVETEEQRRKLSELGCAFAQGYLFARPDSAEQAAELLRHSFLEWAPD